MSTGQEQRIHRNNAQERKEEGRKLKPATEFYCRSMKFPRLENAQGQAQWLMPIILAT
jgi:hypothetical protein